MKNMLKKIVAILMALVMLGSVSAVFAEDVENVAGPVVETVTAPEAEKAEPKAPAEPTVVETAVEAAEEPAAEETVAEVTEEPAVEETVAEAETVAEEVVTEETEAVVEETVEEETEAEDAAEVVEAETALDCEIEEEAEEVTETEEVAEETEEIEEEKAPVSVRIMILNLDACKHFGDVIQMKAVIENGDGTEEVIWELCKDYDPEANDNQWGTFSGKLTVTKDINKYAFRCKLSTGETSGIYTIGKTFTDAEEVIEEVVEEVIEEIAEEVAEEETEEIAEEVVEEETEEVVEEAKKEVYITNDLNGRTSLRKGDKVTLTANLVNYEDTCYAIQWSYSLDGSNWNIIDGATGTTYVVTIDTNTIKYYWHVEVTEIVND